MTSRQATIHLNALIAQCRARRLADRYEDRYPDTAASEADDRHQRAKEKDMFDHG